MVDVDVKTSKKSPQKIGEELNFTASTTGFFKPEFEFFLNQLVQICFHPAPLLFTPVWEKKVVQEKSEERTWLWYPEVQGIYVVEVRAVDLKEKGEAQLPFVVEKEKAQVSILSSKKSPQRKNQEVIFQAATKGLQMPQFEFFLSRLVKWNFHPSLFLLTLEWDEELAQEKSEENTWAWASEVSGLFIITVEAADEMEMTKAMIPFIIEREMEKEAITFILALVGWIDVFVIP
jgi:hypothetical protein